MFSDHTRKSISAPTYQPQKVLKDHSITLGYPKKLKKDLRIWQEFLLEFNCKSFFLEDAQHTSPSIFTQMLLKLKAAVLFWNQLGIWRTAGKLEIERNSVLELYPIVVGLNMWADKLTNQQVIFFSDIESVVHVINSKPEKIRCSSHHCVN